MLARRGKTGALEMAEEDAPRGARSPLRRFRRGSREEEQWRSGWSEATSAVGALGLAVLDDDGAGDDDHETVTGEFPTIESPALDRPLPGASLIARVAEPAVPPAPAPLRSSVTRAWMTAESVPVDGAEMVMRFRRAAVGLALSVDEGTTSGDHARECGAALVALASDDQELWLAPILRADPSQAEVTWTVACYQIGDLSPTTLRDFADASSAVRTLAGCGEAAHVAAELIVTDCGGVRWTALVRSGADVVFQLLESGTASAATATTLLEVRHRWEDQLMDWAARPDHGLTPVVAVSDSPAPLEPAAFSPGDGLSAGLVLGQLLESVRRIEQQLPSGSRLAEPSRSVADTEVRRLGEQIAALEATGQEHFRVAATAAAELSVARERISDLREQVRDLEVQLRETRDQLASSGARIAALEALVRSRLPEWHPG